MTINHDIAKWCQAHDIVVIDTNKRRARYKPLALKCFTDPDNYNVMAYDTVRHETDSVYTIEITESELHRLSAFESQVFNNLRETGHYNLFQAMIQLKEEEKQLRDSNESVRLAYEHYSTLLNLAKEY